MITDFNYKILRRALKFGELFKKLFNLYKFKFLNICKANLNLSAQLRMTPQKMLMLFKIWYLNCIPFLQKGESKDLIDAIKKRRSCRDFIDEEIEKDVILKIIEAAAWATYPLNLQHGNFL